MTTLTEKQQKFAINKAAGVKNRDAAIAAGYAANNADVQAARMMQRDDIKAAIMMAAGAVPEGMSIDKTMPRKHYADPMTFLEDVMNGVSFPVALRVDAAKQLLPYKHARMGELGKKAKAKDRAEVLARTSRFSPQAAPVLRAIDGGKTQTRML